MSARVDSRRWLGIGLLALLVAVGCSSPRVTTEGEPSIDGIYRLAVPLA